MKKVFLFLTMFLFAFTGVTRANVQQNRADQVIEQGFEDGLGDWTMNHCHSSSGPTSSYGGNTGNYAFRFYYTANYPQYLISPELDDNDGVNLTFYAARYSSDYPETFKVGYSLTTNDPTEFTWGSEVTCTTIYGSGAYQEYSYDFPAGTKYVSIACTSNDQFYLFVDDITVTATEPAPAPTPGGIVEVTIGDPTSTDVSSYIPGYTLYEYAISQQIYTADEIGVAGTIETLTMWLKNNSSYARNINVYMTEVEATEFASTTDWVSMSADDMVASFTIENAYNAPIEFAIPLSTPFEYSGTGNLLICFQDVTGDWSSGLGGVVMDAAGNQAIYHYRDGSVFDPSNVGVSGYLLLQKNVIKLSIMTGGGEPKAFATVPAVLDLGYRPNGAWMAPYVFNLKSNVGAVTVNALDFSGNYFTYNAELPATVSGNNPLEVAVSTGTAEAGEVNSTITVLYSGNNRDAEQLDIKATAYDPAEGDVYEQAIDVTSFPYNGTAPAVIYKNYELPEATEGADAVYKMTFANDVMLTAGTTGADGVAALYTEDFAGEGGPMANNNYVYNGPEVAPAPVAKWFYYDNGEYSGSMGAGGTLYWGIKVLASELPAAENCAITKVQIYDANYTGGTSYVLIYEGSALVYSQPFSFNGTNDWQVIDLDTPVLIDNTKDLIIGAYNSGITYPAAGCSYQGTNTDLISFNGTSWTPLSNYGYYYTWMIRAWAETPDRAGAMEITHFDGETSTGSLDQVVASTPVVTRPVGGNSNSLANKTNHNNRYDPIYQIADMYVPAGTYYLAVASTDAEFPVSIATAEVPAPEQAFVLAPMDGETNVEYPYIAEWILGDYTEEMQVLFGTQYPPQTALIDWTTELVAGVVLPELEPNQSYFMQVNERNVAGTTYGEIIAFTTPIDPVEGLEIAESNLYPGDAAVLTWTANARTLKGYNVYVDGVKWNESLINTNSYDVEGLEYNMDGYDIQVSAVYDAGESELSEAVTAYMTGYGSVSGHAYDKPDEDTDAMPIAFATVMFSGSDEYGVNQTFVVETDEEGAFAGEILAGTYTASVITEGYDSSITVNATVNYDALTDEIDIYTHEFYYPVGQVTATDEGNDVLVEWSWNPAELIIDFETGDFSQAEFTLPAQYPWAITTTNPYEGTYCMKSTCEGIASGTSSIEVTAEVPYDGLMGFWVRVSSEQNYDKFHFYIDGVEMGAALSGEAPYSYKEYAVTEGTHTYKFEYTKDSSVNSNDDCIYVDNITMYKQAGPAPSGMTYNFDDNTMMGWTSLDADGDGNGWVSSANPGIYHNSGVSLSGTGHNDSEAYVISGSYANQTGQALTPDNYLVSPAKIAAQNGAAISFYACAQDASYAAEHFGVAVSTGSNTSAADFTTVQEWTMTAKNGRGADEYSAVRGTRQGSWYQYTVDLSAYAGQEIWVAIRHFNCTDMFILNVDDITLGDGTEAMAPRNDRTFQSFNVYRRNNVDAASVADPELIVEGTTDFEYTDAAWETLEFGEWQWGVAATYEGYAPVPERSRETATFGFEGGLEGWTGIVVNTDGGEWLHSDNNPGGYDYTELAHTGAGFALCYSFVDYVGSFDTDAYLVSPQKYSVDANSSISFWADNANDSYPENFSVCVSTAANPTASDFVQIWNGGAKGANVEKAAVRRSDNRYENWRSHEISLAAYAGQEIWIAFHDVNYDQYEIWIDDVTITYAGGAPVPPTPGPTGSGISEIIWSNVIDKDMEATLTFNVSLNNGQSPEGATIAVVGENNTYNATVDETGVVEMVVRKGDIYNITIALEGYVTETTSWIANTNAETFNVTLVEIINNISNLYVSPTGWAMWENATGGVTPPTPPTPPTGILFEDDFEDGAITNWTTVDADGDADTWTNATPAAYGIGDAHSGTNCASSWSWNNYSMDPDNWMISPMVEGAASIQYYVATNTAYPDHYGIYASSTGTNTSDFTLVFEETPGTKGGNGTRSSMTQAGTRAMSDWMERNVDLPAGTKYVAFRHWNSYDNNYLFIDDVTIEGASRGDRAPLSYKVMLDGTYVGESYYPFYQHDVDGMEEGEVHVTSVAPLYASGMGEWMEYTWTYTSCSHFSGVTEFTSSVVDKTVTLNWTLPGGGSGGSASTFSEGFENGLNWNVLTILADGGSWIHSDDNLGGYDYTTHAHSGTGFAMCYSFVDYVGSFNTDSYMYTTEKYSIVNGSTLHFWADNANDSYPENFSVVLSTVDNPTSAADFTQVWSGGAKGTGNGGAAVRHDATRYDNWREHTIDLSAYAGQTAYIGFHDVNYDMYEIWIDDVELSAPAKRDNRDMWDLVYQFDATSGYQYGVATDGENIYTSSWSSSSTSMFYKYDMEGNFIEEFNISGCGQLRGMTYDGEYFYGVANSSTIYCVDLANHTLVGQTSSAYGAMRAITYDPQRDGFWVVGNWSGNITLVDRTGAIVQAGPAPTSASDVAYYMDPDGVEHVFCFNNGTNDVDDYNIANNTITSAVFNFNANPLVTGSTGGCFVGAYDGKTCFFGDIQQSPQHIAIYELDAEGPVPPTPVEGIIGAVLFRDGEFVGMFGANTTTYTEELEEAGQYTYTIRVIYDGDPDVTYYAMSCGDDETVTIIDAVEDNDEVISSIYPNPTSGDLYITATAMKHVTVFNTMGQVVFSSDVNTDSYVLNMGQLEAGVYMVKVDAAQGSSVKRIAVVK